MSTLKARVNEQLGPKAAIYVKYPAPIPAEARIFEPANINDQIVYCEKWAKRRGYTVEKNLIFVEGKNTERSRTEFNALINAAKKGQFEAIFTYDLIEVVHDSEGSTKLRRLRKDYEIKIFTVQDSINEGLRLQTLIDWTSPKMGIEIVTGSKPDEK